MVVGVRRAVSAATSSDGLAVAYLMAVVNAAVVCVSAFGVSLSAEQVAAVTSLANAVLVACVHLLRLSSSWRRAGSSWSYTTSYTTAPPTLGGDGEVTVTDTSATTTETNG